MYEGTYQLIGTELSFFTRKLEAQLRAQQLPWEYLFKTEARRADLEQRAGTHFIPLLITPEKWLLNDTIAIGPLLNNRFPSRSVIPETPVQRASCFILEDAFNHWLGRFCVHSRWCYPNNVNWVGPRIGANAILDRSIKYPFTAEELKQFEPLGPLMLENFGRTACEVNGVGPEHTEMVQRDFQHFLTALSSHLSTANFLLGDRPCLADFALAGACKAHFVLDPEPLSWLGEHQQWLSDYTAQFFEEPLPATGDWLPNDEVAPTLLPLLDYFKDSYYVAASVNIAEGLAGKRFYDVDYGLGNITARTQKRLNLARSHVHNELDKMSAYDHPGVQALYTDRHILAYYTSP